VLGCLAVMAGEERKAEVSVSDDDLCKYRMLILALSSMRL